MKIKMLVIPLQAQVSFQLLTQLSTTKELRSIPNPVALLRSHGSYAMISRLYHHLGIRHFIGRKSLTDAPCSFYGFSIASFRLLLTVLPIIRACPVMCNKHFLHPYLWYRRLLTAPLQERLGTRQHHFSQGDPLSCSLVSVLPLTPWYLSTTT